MVYKKNILIASVALIIALGIWYFGSATHNQTPAPISQQNTSSSTPITTSDTTATSTEAKSASEPTPMLVLNGNTEFTYNLSLGKTPCGDHIGTVKIESSDPNKQLSWGLSGNQPLWLTFSAVEGQTPVNINLTYNCILSGTTEGTIDWQFPVVEMTKSGAYIGGDTKYFTIKGTVTK